VLTDLDRTRAVAGLYDRVPTTGGMLGLPLLAHARRRLVELAKMTA
jgi:hypothetical protein